MIYLLPFINAFLLFITIEDKQILNKPYQWFTNNIAPRLPVPNAILGGCELCALTWMGIIELSLLGLLQGFEPGFIPLVFYNAVASVILFRLMK